MRKSILCCLLVLATMMVRGQTGKNIILETDVASIAHTLASDSMRGRMIFTPDIGKASDFIAGEFKRIGLDTLAGNHGYRQEFTLSFLEARTIAIRMDGAPVPPGDVIVKSLQPVVHWMGKDSCDLVTIGAGEDLFARMRSLLHPDRNTLVCIDTSFAALFYQVRKELKVNNQSLTRLHTVIFVLHSGAPDRFSVAIENQTLNQRANNVVGLLPGKSKPDEYVIFSAHYDHLGVGTPVRGDSIFNGANDDASGTTAVIELARYFKTLGQNERSILFVAFTGEEEGGYGSHFFSRHLDPARIAAMFNIEMIGTESKWGKNSAYITGFDKSDFGRLLQQNLKGTEYRFYPDPYPAQDLFYRSDNATLARLGVPAHSVSTSKMDHEVNYHQVTDEINTLDINNMTHIIRAIAQSMDGIVRGTETPTRVAPQSLE